MPSTLICTCCERSYDSHLMVNCSICKKFYKNTCMDITNNEVRILNGNKGFEWTCKNCKEFGNEFKDVKSLIIKLQEEIKSLKEKCITSNCTKDGFSMEEVIQEISERNERKRNIIILGVPEQDPVHDSATRVAKDKTEVSNILRAVTPALAGLDVKPIRLGKPTPGKHRLIKVTLKEDNQVIELLRAAKNLKGNPAYKSISIFPDRTPMQIDNYKKLKLELDQRTANGEQNLKIRYYKGSPRIVALN
nr:unnamed protein product [Callosobruchus chinensis]